ncbi:MAG: endolytic transglycosylase MltG [Kiritimatiellales bacterium]|nr:endolytic transglycosylase MltG [Kiritimatiellales bacterium]
MKKLLIITLIVLASASLWYKASLRPVDISSDTRLALKIDQGMSVQDIAQVLYDRQIIRSRKAFMIFAKFHGKEAALQAGKFVLRPSMNVAELIEVLQDGKAEEMIVTIPEGFTVKQIDELLAKKGIIEVGEIMDCLTRCDFSSFEFLPNRDGLAEREGILEGYLFPETYYINVDEFVPKFFLERMMTTFRRRVLETFPDQFVDPKRSLHEIITMASLIEEEAIKDDERAVIAGILWKRFDDGKGLGVDATVRYILNKPTSAITTADLNTNSPYNTRKFKGLPPGPIASPGDASIRAALFPEESEYWYYLHGDDGQIRYAKTNEEHNTNRFMYIK